MMLHSRRLPDTSILKPMSQEMESLPDTQCAVSKPSFAVLSLALAQCAVSLPVQKNCQGLAFPQGGLASQLTVT